MPHGMYQHPNTIYRTLRIVESFGVEGCTLGSYAAKWWPGPRDHRRMATAGRMLRSIAEQGLLLRVGDSTGEYAKSAVYHVSEAGRSYLRDATAAAAQVADDRARAHAAQPERDFSQPFEPLFGGGRR